MTCHTDDQYFRCYFTGVYKDYSTSYNFRGLQKKNYTSMVETETHSLVETTTEESPTPTAAGLIKGAVFDGGNFTINISSSSSSIVAQKQQTYKRIKRIFDSSHDDESPPLT